MPIERARELRRNPTEAEIRLWSRLRRKQIAGARFRRQAPLGAFYVDFLRPARRLIIEVDGGQHAERADYDIRRTRWLETHGYTVLRFWNNEVLANTDDVVEVIARWLGENPLQR